MKRRLEVVVEFHGPLAEHNYPCPIYWDDYGYKSVYVCHEGRFDVSWKAQEDGWHIIKADSWFKKKLFELFFNTK